MDRMTEDGLHAAAVRVLVPDHPDLAGQFGRAIEFGAVLRHANDAETADEEPWRLPDQLVAPELEAALNAIVLDWRFDIGNDQAPTQIEVTHAGIGHMGLYIATATRTDLSLLRAALNMMIQAENTPPSPQLPALREVAHFVEAWREADEADDYDVSLTAWQTVVQVLTLAIATAPDRTGERPTQLYNSEGILVPTPPTDGSTPAGDTLTVLDRIDAGDGRTAHLDDAAWRAWQRLTAEWHGAVYAGRANDPDAVLSSFAY
ncbi:hypothetical protein [Nocardia sp. alder85J]|uniref:hypothetical protein n=1 Tax=Nocardia sp. alder85J TaxID=2862949 RepID=UPI001CD5E37C|nr:hypothetical protein [Nocardia sp. alder85J]MCX4097784.1 hypothetical protein [Nocardia sp. alder85J]